MRKLSFPGHLMWLMVIIMLGGCALGSEYKRPGMDLPEQWPEAIELSMAERDEWRDWWLRYDDPVLNELINQAVDYNLDVLTATTRIQAARAQLGLRRAEQFPTVDVQLDASRQDVGPAGGGGAGAGGAFSGNIAQYRLAGALNYEVDLWGRLSQATAAARERLLQTVYSRDAVQLNVIAEVATTYFELRAIQDQINTTRDNIATREEAYELEEGRFEFGASNELALRQAEADLENTRARLPRLVGQARNLRRALALLTGDSPRLITHPQELVDQPLEVIYFDTEIPTVVPSSILERRPDIRAAEAGLKAANYDITVARANWYPQLNLATTLGRTGIDVGSMFLGPATIWSLGGSIIAPLLDFGAREAEVEGAEAERDIAELEYRGTLRAAFVEVGDAWSLLEAANEELEVRNREVSALREAVRLAQSRYEGGFSSYLEVLDTRRSLYEAELLRTDAARDRLAATVTLYKALGGGWQESASITAD